MIATDTALPRTHNVITRGIEDGLHLGAQLFVMLDGQVVADLAVGESRPGQPLRTDDLMLWLSAGKPVTAVAVMRLVERGKLGLDDRVAKHIPEFAQHGKDNITVRHLLTHTADLRAAAGNANGRPWDEVIADICAARPEPRWVFGETAGYTASATWYVLGELVRRASATPFDQYAREKVLVPIGMNDSWLGMPPLQFRAYGKRLAPVYATDRGSLDQDQFNNTEAGAVQSRPGANARGPVRELGRFYEMIRNKGVLDGHRVLLGATVDDMTARQRAGKPDKTFGHVIDWGLGFILAPPNRGGGTDEAGDGPPYGYGPYASAGTFGHSGSQSSCAFCDPRHGLVVAWACNGMPGEPAHQRRQRCINAGVYEDLGLAG